jgi:hypothetical protein
MIRFIVKYDLFGCCSYRATERSGRKNVKNKKVQGNASVNLLATIVVMAALVGTLLGWARNRNLATLNECRDNLHRLGVIKFQEALLMGFSLTNSFDEKKLFGPFGLRPTCPGGGEYNIGATVCDPPTCSIPFHNWRR